MTPPLAHLVVVVVHHAFASFDVGSRHFSRIAWRVRESPVATVDGMTGWR